MRSLALALSLIVALATAHAAVVRPAPDFSIPGIGKLKSLKALRGQPVVLVIAESPRTGDFKEQARNLKDLYQQFASKQVVFIAALGAGEGLVKSDIPFVLANNGPAVASAYGATEDFTLVIIGKDGNVDYQTTKVCTPERVRDVIQNSFEVQEGSRKE